MAAILATIDVEDLGSAKVRDFKDALSDLLSVQQQVSASGGALAGSLQGGITALGATNNAARTAAAGLNETVNALDDLVPAATAAAQAQAEVFKAPSGGLRDFINLIEEEISTLQQAEDNTRSIGQALQVMQGMLRDTGQVTKEAAAAFDELGSLGLAEVAVESGIAFDQLNAKLQAGVPLTEAEVAAFNSLVDSFQDANAEALGLASATEQLVSQQRAAEQLAQSTATAFGILADQMEAGATVTQLQKDALAELATSAQDIADIAEADRAALQALNEQIRVGAEVTPQQAAEFERLNQVIQDSIATTNEEVDALQDLIDSEREAAAAASQRVAAVDVLERQLKEGAEVTQEQKAAMEALNTATKDNTDISQHARSIVDGLNNTLTVGNRITAEQAAAMKVAGAAIRQAGTETEKATGKFEAFKASTAVIATVLATLTAGLYSFLQASASVAARNEVLATSMGVIAKNANLSTIEIQAQIERVKGLGITTSAATQSVIEFIQAELNLADASRVARAAQDLAVIANTNSSEAFERLTTAIQIQQPRLLRQFGIMVTLDQIYSKYAQTVGKTADDLSVLEKRQAFVNTILEEAQKVAGAYESAMGDVGKQQQSLARLWEEAQNILGQNLLPVMRFMVEATTALLKGFQALSPEVQRFITIILAAATAATTISALFTGAKFLGVTKVFGYLIGLVKQFGDAFKAAGVAAAASPFFRRAEGAALDGFYKAAMAAKNEVGLLSKAWSAFTLVATKNQWGLVITAAVTALSLLLTKLVGVGDQARKTSDQLREQFGKVVADINNVNDAVTKLAQARTNADILAAKPQTPVVQALSADAQTSVKNALKEVERLGVDAANAIQKVNGEWKVNADVVAKATTAQQKHADTLRDETLRAIDDINKKIADEEQALRDLKFATDDVATANENAQQAYEGVLAAQKESVKYSEIQTSVWQDLADILSGRVIILWDTLSTAIGRVWQWFKLLPGVIAEGFSQLAKMDALPPGIQQIVDLMDVLVNKLWPKARESLHANAQATNDYVAAMSRSKEQQKADREQHTANIKLLEIERGKLVQLVEEADRTGRSLDLLAKAGKQAYEKLGLAGKQEAEERKKLIAAGAGDLAKFIEAAVVGGDKALAEKLKLPLTAEGVAKAMDLIAAKVTDYTEKQKKLAKQAEEDAKKHKQAVLDFLGVDEEFAKKLKALNEALAQSKGDFSLYNEVLLRGSKVIAEYNKLTEEQKAALGDFGEVMKAGPIVATREWIAVLGEAQKAAQDTFRTAEEAVTEMATEMSAASTEFSRQLQEQRIEDQRTANEKIAEIDRELVDQQVALFGTAEQQAIHAEQRRFEAIERSLNEEIRLREQATRQQLEDINRREQAQLQEINLLFRRIQIEQELERLQRRIAVEQSAHDKERFEAATNQLNAFNIATEEINKRLDALRSDAVAQTQDDADRQRQQVARNKAAYDEMTADQKAALERQRRQHEVNIRLIKLNYNDLRNFTIQAFQGVVSATLQGFARMLEGATSFKDVMVSIWRSITNSVFGFIEQMVQKWISEWIKAKTAQKALNLAGGFLGAPGQGFGLGAPSLPTSGGSNTLGGAVIGGAVGGSVGFAVGSSTGSFLGGALAGAASGAAAGAAVGGLPGALIGGAIGLVAGLFGAGKARREAEQARDAYIEAAGGIQLLTERAEEAGVSLRNLMKANDPGEIKKAVEELDKALKLREAKEGLARTYTDFVTLRRQIQLVGGDIQKLYNAKTVEEFNAEQAKLNDLLEEQKRRLDGLGRAAQGLATRLQGEFATLQKELLKIFPDEGQIEDFFKAFADARARGFAGTAGDFARGADRDEFDLDEADIQKITELVERAQKLIDRLSLQVTATFAGILQETGDIVQAMNAVMPALDQIILLQEKFGLTASESLKPLLELRQVIKDNEDIAVSLSGLTQTLLGLADAGRLNQDLFNTFGQDAVSLFTQLQERGVSTNNILLLMQPTLQALWEAQREFGFQTDAATQALLDQAEAAGVVGAQQQDINKKILDVLVIIAQTLGADIPAAYVAAGQAAANFGSRARGEAEATGQAVERNIRGPLTMAGRDVADLTARFAGLGREGVLDPARYEILDLGNAAKSAADDMDDLADAAEEAGRQIEDAMYHAAEGRSPTGVKQVVLRLQEAVNLTRELQDAVVVAGRVIENETALTVPDWSMQGVERESGETTSYVTVNVDGRATFTVNGTKATAREEWDRLKPEVVAQLRNNTNQFAKDVGNASGRYPRGVGRNVRTPR